MYGGKFASKSVSTSTDTEIARIELPAGIYIAVGYSEINVDSNSIYLLRIDNNPRIRYSGSAGGGACISAIVVMEEPGVTKFSMLAVASGIKSYNVEFRAVKIANIKQEKL